MIPIYYDERGELLTQDPTKKVFHPTGGILLGEVEEGGTFKVLYSDQDCDGWLLTTSFKDNLDDQGFLVKFTDKVAKDECENMMDDEESYQMKFWVTKYRLNYFYDEDEDWDAIKEENVVVVSEGYDIEAVEDSWTRTVEIKKV